MQCVPRVWCLILKVHNNRDKMSNTRAKRLTKEREDIIISARSRSVKFSEIGRVLDLEKSRLTNFHSRHQLMQRLGEPPQITNRLTDGRVGLQIKALVNNQEFHSCRKAVGQLHNLLGPSTPVPSKSSIHRFLKANNFKNYKLKFKSHRRVISS